MTPLSWFSEARYGMFLHFGPYSALGRGEQILFRDHLDHGDYAARAMAWNPSAFDAAALARLAADAGMRYAVFTTRHHDGYCLWDSALTDYTSAAQAPRRDFVREYVEAFRAAGLRVGLYYSLADWRIPAYWEGPGGEAAAWDRFRDYAHGQVRELLTRYGKIDVIWFDGVWPRTAEEWRSRELIAMIRELQPEILINNRLDIGGGGIEAVGASKTLGDFGTPEHEIVAETGRPWESCQVTTWRLWGYARGERYRSSEQLLDMLCQCAAKGGNLLLNVAPDGEGRVPDPVEAALREVGAWLQPHGEAIYGTEAGEVAEFTPYGYQSRRGDTLYLIYRFWPHAAEARVPGLRALACEAALLSSAQPVKAEPREFGIALSGLPVAPPCALFPVIRLRMPRGFDLLPWARSRLWHGDPLRMLAWSATRGTTVWTDGKERP